MSTTRTAAAAAAPGDTPEKSIRGGNLRVSRRSILGAVTGVTFLFAVDGGVALAEPGERRIALFNPHTSEAFRDVYWSDGHYVQESLRDIDWLMRDFHTQEVIRVDPRLIDLLRRIGDRLDATNPFLILSGYRSAATNRLLRREGMAVAAHSLHLQGQAADIRIEDVPIEYLRRAALAERGGGVGTYPDEHFIHVDVGPVRAWRHPPEHIGTLARLHRELARSN